MLGRTIALALPCALTACVQTHVVENDTESSISQHRTEVRPEVPSLSADFRLVGRSIVGRLKSAACRHERTWVTEHTETTQRRGNIATGVVLASAGAVAISVAAALSRPNADDYSCQSFPPEGNAETGRVVCGYPHEDPTAPTALAISGAVALVAGTALLLWPKKTETKRAEPVPHRQEVVSGCVLPSELDQLEIGVEIANGRWLPIPLEFDGSGHANLPADVVLQSGTSLPVAVLEVPASAADVVRRGQSLGLVVVP